MRLSAFNVYVEDHPDPGDTLVYNTFTGGFVVLDRRTRAVLEAADKNRPLSDEDRALLDELTPDLSDESVGVLVASRSAEEQAFRAWYEEHRSKTDKLSAVVSVTFACNLDCTYCCQADVMDGRTMSWETAEQTAIWLAERARSAGVSLLELCFTGGEPLLHPGRIERMVHEIHARLAGTGIQFKFNLITNGVFLTPERVDAWIPLGLVGAQITLDGDETTHDVTRRSKKRGESSYATIFRNLISAAEKINVSVNGNYQTDTIHGFHALIGKLRDAGLRPGTRVRFSPALQALGAPVESGSGACTFASSNPELMIAFTDEAYRAGFNGYIDSLYKIGPCDFHVLQSFAIDCEGIIYKCPGFLGKTDWSIGHVSSGLTQRYDSLVNIRPQRECGSCAHRPDCAGGCVAAEWVKHGRTEGVNCEIGFFETNKRAALVRKYAFATSQTTEDAVSSFPEPIAPQPASPVIPRIGGQVALRVLAA